jgi:integrase/recombinase XerD
LLLALRKQVSGFFASGGFGSPRRESFTLRRERRAPLRYPIMVTQFALRKQKKNKAGECPVYLMVYFDGARLACSTGEKCKPTDWNDDRQQFRRSFPLAEEANQLLARLEADVLAWWRGVRASGEVPTVASLKAALRLAVAAPPAPEPLMVDELRAFREVQRTRGIMRYTLKHYLVTANWLRDFEAWSGVRLLVSRYDLAQHDALLAYLRDVRGLAPNTCYTAGKDLSRLLRYLQDERNQVLAVEPKKLRVAWVETEKLYLQADELARLASALLPSTLAPVRDVFLFCCYTGLRYSDVLQLHGGNVEALADGSGRVLRFTQTKTRTKVSVYLTRAASIILDKYACAERHGQSARLLPVLTNQAMNRYLKRIGQLINLTRLVETSEVLNGQMAKRAVPAWQLLTMHAARHSFAVQSLLRGVPVAVLQRVMGHANITTTMIYAKVVEDFQHAALRAAWDGTAAAPQQLDGEICEARVGAA